MKLVLSENDAKNLVRMIEFSESVVGYMNDYINDPKIAMRSLKWSALKEIVFKAAFEQGHESIIEQHEYGYSVIEKEFESSMELQDEFEELTLHSKLANKLAWRDFYEHYSPAEIEAMAKDKKMYLGVELHPFEEKYWHEFEAHEYTRLRIDE